MKKTAFVSVLLAGSFLSATPVFAAGLDVKIGGHFRGYGVYADNNEAGTSAAGDDLRQVDLRQDSELHFSGEAKFDHGLTVGMKAEIKTMNDTAATSSVIDETYLYFSGSWGRVNVGSTDAAAYLLQVSAPSADANVDGHRVQIQALDLDALDDGDTGNASALVALPALGYQNAVYSKDTKLTYLTPKFSGFQAGVSWAPEQGANALGNNTAAMNEDDNGGDYEHMTEAALRWDGTYKTANLSAGAGWLHADREIIAAAGQDDRDAWNAGINLSCHGFSLGAAYFENNNGLSTADSDTEVWVLGLGWDSGPWHLAASWHETTFEAAQARTMTNVGGGGDGGDLEIERLTLGGGFKYAPGMTLRAAASFGTLDVNDPDTARDDNRFTQVTLGTEVKF